ncbi:Receptor tyrosine-protein kinase erbB-2 [Mactra antiquata]
MGTVKEIACYGTRNGFSITGPLRNWYNQLRARYTGCTHVLGNLEITQLERAAVPNIDLSFLATIEVVTGYVIIVNVEADVIPFTNLRHILADDKYNMGGTDYALLVLLSDVRDGLQMPKIKEISGNVMFYLWSSCYPQSIVWDSITKGTTNYSNVKGLECDDCHPSCLDTDGQRRCWGPGKDLCQKANRMKCAWLCRNGSCFEKGILGCCHPDCLGCYDDWINTECEVWLTPEADTKMAYIKYMCILIFIVLLNVFSGVTSTRIKACYGTRNGFSITGPLRNWYNQLRTRYTGCTHVLGNLEITQLERAAVSNIDLSFLATIEVVTGYVLIVNVEADVIPFTNLRHILADDKYNMDGTDYALLVLLSDVRDGLQMPKIKGISGNVMFNLWASCYPQSVVWDSITEGTIYYSDLQGLECNDCHPSCLDTEGQRRCWGPGKDLCQKA